jgi:hypothetical protein
MDADDEQSANFGPKIHTQMKIWNVLTIFLTFENRKIHFIYKTIIQLYGILYYSFTPKNLSHNNYNT